MKSLALIALERRSLVADMHDVFQPRVTIEMIGLSTILAHIQVQSLLRDEIVVA